MKHLLTAIACCLAVAGSAQTEWGFASLTDSSAVTRPAWVIYEPITAEYQDAVANALYGGWEFFNDWQEGWLPWLGLQNSGCSCAENGEEWAAADEWLEMYFSGQFPAPAPIEVDVHQTSQNLFEIADFEIAGGFGSEYADLEGWLIVPEASVGHHGGWRIEFMTVNCNPIVCCNCEASVCGQSGHERSFYVEPGFSIPSGWYLLFKLPESYASGSSPITDYWTSNAWSCIGCEGCTDADACNYYDYDITDDSKCNYISCNQGCMDELACNFDAEATFDNATCSYAIPGYTCDGTLATAFCGEGTVWNDALQQCIVADPTPVGETCLGDLDGDGLRAVSDLLLFLSVFGEPCSDQEVEENELSAIVFMECNADALGNGPNEQDILTYMVEENFSGTWFGFYVNGAPNNPSDADAMATYMDWPGWINGTENNLIGTMTAAVPTESIGTDSFGNANLAHAFETIEIPQNTLNGQTWFSVWVPLQLLEESDLPQTIMYNYNGQANSFTAAQVSTSTSSIDVEYSGPNWPHGTYRVFTSGLNAGLNVGSGWNASNYYLKGGD
jgi:hypothetical protein